jgi:hypothetical protein
LNLALLSLGGWQRKNGGSCHRHRILRRPQQIPLGLDDRHLLGSSCIRELPLELHRDDLSTVCSFVLVLYLDLSVYLLLSPRSLLISGRVLSHRRLVVNLPESHQLLLKEDWLLLDHKRRYWRSLLS